MPQPDPPPSEYALGDYGTSFYGALSPYGDWTQFPGYGWCWQPSVCRYNRGWQPYGDNGNWIWSDAGWYWNSSYPWGWAPFHYGRWWRHPQRGWCWQPGRQWGPGWVTWRASLGAGGWAPLPPGSGFEAGGGWTCRGRSMGQQYGFGLPASAFTFVPFQRLTDPNVFDYRLSPAARQAHFGNSVVVANFRVGPGNQVFNRGIDPRRVVMATGTPVPQTPLRLLNRPQTTFGSPVNTTRFGVTTRFGPSPSWQRQLEARNGWPPGTAWAYAPFGFGFGYGGGFSRFPSANRFEPSPSWQRQLEARNGWPPGTAWAYAPLGFGCGGGSGLPSFGLGLNSWGGGSSRFGSPVYWGSSSPQWSHYNKGTPGWRGRFDNGWRSPWAPIVGIPHPVESGYPWRRNASPGMSTAWNRHDGARLGGAGRIPPNFIASGGPNFWRPNPGAGAPTAGRNLFLPASPTLPASRALTGGPRMLPAAPGMSRAPVILGGGAGFRGGFGGGAGRAR